MGYTAGSLGSQRQVSANKATLDFGRERLPVLSQVLSGSAEVAYPGSNSDVAATLFYIENYYLKHYYVSAVSYWLPKGQYLKNNNTIAMPAVVILFLN